MGPAQLAGAGFRDPDRADLAFLLEPAELTDRLLDRNLVIDPVQVIEVDVFEPEPAQARLHRLAGGDGGRVRRRAVSPVGELAGQDDPVPPARDGLTEQGLVVPRPVAGGGVEEGDPELDRPVDQADRVGIVRAAIDAREAHASQAQAADGKCAELRHGLAPWVWFGRGGASQKGARRVAPNARGVRGCFVMIEASEFRPQGHAIHGRRSQRLINPVVDRGRRDP